MTGRRPPAADDSDRLRKQVLQAWWLGDVRRTPYSEVLIVAMPPGEAQPPQRGGACPLPREFAIRTLLLGLVARRWGSRAESSSPNGEKNRSSCGWSPSSLRFLLALTGLQPRPRGASLPPSAAGRIGEATRDFARPKVSDLLVRHCLAGTARSSGRASVRAFVPERPNLAEGSGDCGPRHGKPWGGLPNASRAGRADHFRANLGEDERCRPCRPAGPR